MVVGNGGLGLIGISLPLQIPGLRAPDVGPVLGGPAIGRVVNRVLHQSSVIIDAQPCGVVHRPVAGVRGTRAAAAMPVVYLAVHAVADIEAVGAQVLIVPLHKSPGADGLRLQGLQRPCTAHFIGDNALHIVLQADDIHHVQIPAGYPGILKAAAVLIALEPRGGLPP